MTEQSEYKRIRGSLQPGEAYEKRSRDEIGQPTAKFEDLFRTSGDIKGKSTQSNFLQLPGTNDPRLVYRTDKRHSLKGKYSGGKWAQSILIVLRESLGKIEQLISRFMNFLKRGR